MSVATRTSRTLWSIGHSNHSLERFVDLLKQHEIEVVVDVRTAPYSRYVPQFGREVMADALPRMGVRYLYLGWGNALKAGMLGSLSHSFRSETGTLKRTNRVFGSGLRFGEFAPVSVLKTHFEINRSLASGRFLGHVLAAVGAVSITFSAHAQSPRGIGGGWIASELAPSGSVVLGADGSELVGYFRVGYGSPVAYSWNAVTSSRVSLHPNFAPNGCAGTVYTYYTASSASAAQGGQQVGSTGTVGVYQGSILTYCPGRAAIWNGTAGSWVDIGPPNLSSSAYAVANGQQVGAVWFTDSTGLRPHASLWTGTAASWTDLHPGGLGESVAYAASDGRQAGYTKGPPTNSSHASLWSGTASSWVDLNPLGARGSLVRALSGGRQGGYANVVLSNGAGQTHAGLWSGTPESWVDLHPAGAKESIVYGMFGEYQVGYAVFDVLQEAGIWKGTAASWTSLASLFLQNQPYHSQAFAISSDGISLFVGGFPYLWSRPLCLGDFNRTGVSDVQDILDFLNAWFAGDARANFNGSTPTFNGNGLSVEDIFDFLNAWFAGC